MPLEAKRPRRAERWNQRLVSEESAFYKRIGAGDPGSERRRKALRTCCGWLLESILTCQERACAFESVRCELWRGLKSLLFHDSSLEAEGGGSDLKNANGISGGFGENVPYESPRRGSRVYDTAMRTSES